MVTDSTVDFVSAVHLQYTLTMDTSHTVFAVLLLPAILEMQEVMSFAKVQI
jgi:hypothetical protein